MVLSSLQCALCDDGAAVWMHRLDMEKSRFRVYGKEHIWAEDLATCRRCEELYQAGDDEGLVAVYHRDWQKTSDDIQEGIRSPLRAFRHADLGATSIADWLPPGAAELVAQGFVPIDDLTGADDVAEQWPEAHRHAVPETRHDHGGGMLWLVRSPWPSIPIREVVDLMWQWVWSRRPQRSGRVTEEDKQEEKSLVREFLHRDETWVEQFRRTGR